MSTTAKASRQHNPKKVWGKRILKAGFWFFFIKGMLWLVGLGLAYFFGVKIFG